MFKRIVLPLVLIAALATLYFWAALSWSFSSGERAGWVQKLSKKGWLCKTWEGELALVSLPGTTPEKFLFTIHDDAAAARVTQVMGKRVTPALRREGRPANHLLRRDAALRQQRDGQRGNPARRRGDGAHPRGVGRRLGGVALTGRRALESTPGRAR